MNKPKLMASGLLIAAFASGIVVGGTGSAVADLNFGDTDSKDRSYVDWLQDELNLMPYQRVAIEEMTEQFDIAIHDLWAEVRPRSDSIRWHTRVEIAEVLDEEQKEIYDRLNARIDSVRAVRQQQHDEKRKK